MDDSGAGWHSLNGGQADSGIFTAHQIAGALCYAGLVLPSSA